MTDAKTISKPKFLTVQRMALIAIFAALTCVCSWISVPSPFNPAVPFTLQTLAIILTGLILSPLEAAFTSLVYLLLGLVGLPVLAGFGTFYSRIFTASGGYIIGFYITPFIISLVRTAIFKALDKKEMSKAKKKTIHFVIYLVLAIVLGILCVDIPGLIQGKLITNTPWLESIFLFALSFMPTDILKCVAAAILASALETPLAIIKKKKQ
jgi:biotin transport system substrate-specific component